MVPGILDRLYNLIHNMRGRRNVRIAHPEVDNIFSGPSQFHLEFVHYLENVGGKSLNPSEFFHLHLPSGLAPDEVFLPHPLTSRLPASSAGVVIAGERGSAFTDIFIQF